MTASPHSLSHEHAAAAYSRCNTAETGSTESRDRLPAALMGDVLSAIDATGQFSFPRGTSIVDRTGHRHSAELTGVGLASPVAVVRTYRHIDATNAAALTAYALAYAINCRGLILDLRCLDFFGTEGFSALHRVSVGCAHAGKPWAMIPGVEVSRLLQICDPQGALPTADSVGAAVAAISDGGAERTLGQTRPIATAGVRSLW